MHQTATSYSIKPNIQDMVEKNVSISNLPLTGTSPFSIKQIYVTLSGLTYRKKVKSRILPPDAYTYQKVLPDSVAKVVTAAVVLLAAAEVAAEAVYPPILNPHCKIISEHQIPVVYSV